MTSSVIINGIKFVIEEQSGKTLPFRLYYEDNNKNLRQVSKGYLYRSDVEKSLRRISEQIIKGEY